MQTSGRQEVGWRKQIGRRRRSCHLTRTLAWMRASGRIHTLHVSPPPLKTGGISMELGTSLIPRRWILLGYSATLLFMTTARTLTDTLWCQRSVPWAHGINPAPNLFFFFQVSELLFLRTSSFFYLFNYLILYYGYGYARWVANFIFLKRHSSLTSIEVS